MGERLGQHFLRGTWAAAALAKEAAISSGDTVLEIGPGKGVLTRELLRTGARVIAIEKDEGLVVVLQEVFPSELASGQLHIVEGDVRNFDPSGYGLRATDYKLAANIPYYITGEILRQFLTAAAQPRTMALLVQKEVADRIVARDGKESILSNSVKAYGMPRIAAKVSKGNFSPPPKVDSAILVIENISRDFFSDVNEKRFFEIVRKGFSSKRKLLASNLETEDLSKSRVLDVFKTCEIPDKARAEDITLNSWKCLSKNI